MSREDGFLGCLLRGLLRSVPRLLMAEIVAIGTLIILLISRRGRLPAPHRSNVLPRSFDDHSCLFMIQLNCHAYSIAQVVEIEWVVWKSRMDDRDSVQ